MATGYDASSHYTNFRAVTVKEGIIRLADPWQNTTYVATKATDGTIGVRLQIAAGTLTGNKTLHVCDGSGSMFIKGYHIAFGSTTVNGSMSLVPVGGFYLGTAAVTGVLTTSVILTNIYATSGAGAAITPVGAVCRTAGIIDFFLTNVTAATVGAGVLAVNYLILHPQTS